MICLNAGNLPEMINRGSLVVSIEAIEKFKEIWIASKQKTLPKDFTKALKNAMRYVEELPSSFHIKRVRCFVTTWPYASTQPLIFSIREEDAGKFSLEMVEVACAQIPKSGGVGMAHVEFTEHALTRFAERANKKTVPLDSLKKRGE